VFDVFNNWYNQSVLWNISNPSITNTTFIDNNRSLMVFIENNYTSQGNNKVEINAKVSSFVDKVTDFFEIRPLQVANFQTLTGGQNKTVFEINARNNLNITQSFTWKVDTTQQNISNTTTINSSDVFIFVETNYTTKGVYKTTAFLNSSSYNDNQSSAVVALP
jgi:hypothetical protein